MRRVRRNPWRPRPRGRAPGPLALLCANGGTRFPSPGCKRARRIGRGDYFLPSRPVTASETAMPTPVRLSPAMRPDATEVVYFSAVAFANRMSR